MTLDFHENILTVWKTKILNCFYFDRSFVMFSSDNLLSNNTIIDLKYSLQIKWNVQSRPSVQVSGVQIRKKKSSSSVSNIQASFAHRKVRIILYGIGKRMHKRFEVHFERPYSWAVGKIRIRLYTFTIHTLSRYLFVSVFST